MAVVAAVAVAVAAACQLHQPAEVVEAVVAAVVAADCCHSLAASSFDTDPLSGLISWTRQLAALSCLGSSQADNLVSIEPVLLLNCSKNHDFQKQPLPLLYFFFLILFYTERS